jgi:hypothetical protein
VFLRARWRPFASRRVSSEYRPPPVLIPRSPTRGGAGRNVIVGRRESRNGVRTAAAFPAHSISSSAIVSRLHSTTSSASSRIVFGITRPSALAVFKLITISNFVGCSTPSRHLIPSSSKHPVAILIGSRHPNSDQIILSANSFLIVHIVPRNRALVALLSRWVDVSSSTGLTSHSR